MSRAKDFRKILIDEGLTPEQVELFGDWIETMVERERLAEAFAFDGLNEAGEYSYAQAAAAITGTESVATIEMARQARTLAQNLTEQQIKVVGEEIAKGLKEGYNVDTVARRLKTIEGLDSNKAKQYWKQIEALPDGLSPEEFKKRSDQIFNKLLRERRILIANTEGNNAMSSGRDSEARAGGATHKYWINVGDGRVSDGCLANSGAGVIDIDKSFPSGHSHTPRFPGCRCTIGYVFDERTKALREAETKQWYEDTVKAREALENTQENE